jgi:hypothetical protein
MAAIIGATAPLIGTMTPLVVMIRMITIEIAARWTNVIPITAAVILVPVGLVVVDPVADLGAPTADITSIGNTTTQPPK